MTLQEQYNLIKENKGHKGVFLTEAKKQFPSLLTNPMGFEEVVNKLKQKSVISENYIDLKPISNYESSRKEDWENSFNNFLKEEIKADLKKTDSSVDDLYKKGFDSSDKKNLDNQIGSEVQKGVYFEAKENPDKSLEEIMKMVSKNLEKDPLYYKKNAAFGVKGLGLEQEEAMEVSGKYKESGYSDKLKKLVKESLLKEEIDSFAGSDPKSGNIIQSTGFDWSEYEPGYGETYQISKAGSKSIPYYVIEKTDGSEQIDMFFDTPEDAQEYAEKKGLPMVDSLQEAVDDESIEKTKELTDATKELSKAKEEAGIKEIKKKPKSLDEKFKDIETQSEIVTLETKLQTIDEIIESKQSRLTNINEDEALSDLVDKKKIKELQKEIKILEKRKSKLEALYEKKTGKSYKQDITEEDYN